MYADTSHFGQECIQLQQTVESLRYPRVCQTYELHILKLDELGELRRFAHAKYNIDYIVRRVTELPQMRQYLHGLVKLLLHAVLDHLLDEDGMRLVAHLEHVLAVHVSEAVVCGLQIVDGLSHVALGSKYDRLKTVVRVAQLLELAQLQQPLQYLFVAEFRVAQDGAPRLDGLNDFGRVIAGQTKPSCARVDFHDTPQ